MQSEVMRLCVVTKKRYAKKDLIRIVRTPDGRVLIDDTSKLNGKGAYLRLEKDVILKARKSKVLDRALDKSVPDDIYDELLKRL